MHFNNNNMYMFDMIDIKLMLFNFLYLTYLKTL